MDFDIDGGWLLIGFLGQAMFSARFLVQWIASERAGNSVVPMAFCFPGYDRAGSDLPPPALCAATWRARALAVQPGVRLTLLIGGHAQRWHLGRAAPSVTATVEAWRSFGPDVIPLPHPSWRNTAWLKKHPWFEADLLPGLRARVSKLIARR